MYSVNNIISKQKRLDYIARPKLLRTPCRRRYFFTATNDSSHIVSSHLLYQTRQHSIFCHGIKRFFTHCVKPFDAPYSRTCTTTFQTFKQKHTLPSRNFGHRHKNDATPIQQVPGSNVSDMQRKWSCKETYRNMQASFAQSFLL